MFITLKNKNLAIWLLSMAFLFAPLTAQADEENTQNILHTLQGHWERVSDVAFSPDGKYVATASEDSNIIVWNVKSGSQRFTIKWHDRSVNATAFSPDSKYIYSGSENGQLSIYSVKKGKQKKAYSTSSGGITDLNYSPDGKSIIVSYLSGKTPVAIISTKKKGRRLKTLKGHKEMVHGAMFSPDGKSALTYALDGKIVIWDVKTGNRRLAINSGKYSIFDDVIFSSDGRSIISSESGSIDIWDAKSGHKEKSILESTDANMEEYELFFSIAAHPNGRTIATGSSNGNIYLWDLKTGTLQKTLEGHTDQVRTLDFNADGTLLVSGSFDTKAIIWRLN